MHEGLGRTDTVRIPSKSAPQRYGQWLEQEDDGHASGSGEQTLELTQALMKATKPIRKRGLKVRRGGATCRVRRRF